jgi:hypothetical protein
LCDGRLDFGPRIKIDADDADAEQGLSMCSTSFTDVVSTRSFTNTIRFSISSAGIPVNCQTTLTTGMLISGKISVDMR